MSVALIGALVGAAVGIVNYAVLRMVAGRIESGARDARAASRAGIVRGVALLDLMAFPVLGFFLAPLAFD